MADAFGRVAEGSDALFVALEQASAAPRALDNAVEREYRRASFESRINARVHDASAMLAFVEAGGSIAVPPELALIRSHTRPLESRPLEMQAHGAPV